MDLLNLLTKLQAIDGGVQEAKELKGGQKQLDKDKDGDIDKHDFAHMRKQKNEDIENVLRHLQAIQEGSLEEAEEACPKCGEVHEGDCVNEGFMDTVKGMLGGSKPQPGRLVTYPPAEFEFHVPFNRVDYDQNKKPTPVAGTGPGYGAGAIYKKFTDLARIVEPQGGKLFVYPGAEQNDLGFVVIKVKSNLDGKTIKNELVKNKLFPENMVRGILVKSGQTESKTIEECSDMEMSPLTDPTAGYDMAPMAAMAQQAEPEMAAEPAQEEKPRFTLSIQNGDSNLSMSTDVPDEIIHVMKLAGVKGKAEVKPAEPKPEAPEGEEQEVEEAWGNTPSATNEKEPRAYGDIRDWALKGTGKGREGFGDRRAPGQGDNPLSESAMLNEYRKFKAGK